MLKRIKTKRKLNKKALSSLEMIGIFIIFVLMLGFFFDSFTILNQHYAATREANIVTRQIAIQGGVGTGQPANYSRMGGDYKTSLSINKRMKERLNGVNINDFTMYLNPKEEGIETGYVELSPAAIVQIPYQNAFEFRVDYNYEWNILSQMIPGMGGTRTRTIQRSAVSELGVR